MTAAAAISQRSLAAAEGLRKRWPGAMVADGVVLMQERSGCPGRAGDLNRLRDAIPGRLKGVVVSNCSSPAQH